MDDAAKVAGDAINPILANIQNNLVALIGVVIALFYFIRHTQKMDKENNERFKSFMGLKDSLDFFRMNFDTFKNLIQSTTEDYSGRISHRIIYQIDELSEQLDKIFSNGSSKELALTKLDGFNFAITGFIGERDEPGSDRFIYLLDVLTDKFRRLIEQLSVMTDYSVKPKLLTPYTASLISLVNYFVINNQKLFSTLTQDEIIEHLNNRFDKTNSRRNFSENPVV